jgi:hypothetical protein
MCFDAHTVSMISDYNHGVVLCMRSSGEISGGMEGHACKNCDWERPAPEREDRVSTAEAAAVHNKDESSCDASSVLYRQLHKRWVCVSF